MRKLARVMDSDCFHVLTMLAVCVLLGALS